MTDIENRVNLSSYKKVGGVTAMEKYYLGLDGGSTYLKAALMKDKKVLLSIKDLQVKFRVRGKRLTAIRGVSLDIY